MSGESVAATSERTGMQSSPLPQRPVAAPLDSMRHLFQATGHSSGDHVFEFTFHDVFLIFCFSIPTLCLMFYLVKLLYRCCCSRNYAEWRSSWSQLLNSVFSRTYRRKRQLDPAKLFDAVPLKLRGHTEEIESVSSSLESPFVATHCIGGDVIVWDALSGECHTLIRRRSSPSHTVSHAVVGRTPQSSGFRPHHRPSDSLSSDSTYSSSCSSSGSEAHSDVAFLSKTPDPQSNVCPQSNGTPAPAAHNPANTGTSGKSHRRHHSMSSIGASISGRFAAGSRPHNQQQQAYDFSASFSRMNSSRELLTDLVRSACSTNSLVHSVAPLPANSCVESQLTYRPIWTMEMFGKFLYIGCENGRIEVWDALTGSLSYFNDRSSSGGGGSVANGSPCDRSGDNGVTAIRVNNTKMIVGYLDGILETFHLQPRNNLPTATSSALLIESNGCVNRSSALFYTLCHVSRAHRQPITTLQMNSCNIVTGSMDHLVKVHSLDAGSHVYTLNGHCGGITSIEIDPTSPTTAVSGCQVGQVCVWDLQTGTCLFSVEAHRDAAVSSILPTPRFLVTSGTDDKIFIWDKQAGNLLHTIHQSHSMCKQMILLSTEIIVTARDDCLVLYNLSDGREVRVVDISDSSRTRDHSSLHSNCMIKNLRLSSQSRAVVCDYGLQFCVVHFPAVADKYD